MKTHLLFTAILLVSGSLIASAQSPRNICETAPEHYYTFPSTMQTIPMPMMTSMLYCSEGKLFIQTTCCHDYIYDLSSGAIIKDNPLNGGRNSEYSTPDFYPQWVNGYAIGELNRLPVILDAQGNIIFKSGNAGDKKPIVYKIESKEIVDGMILATKYTQKDPYKNQNYEVSKKEMVYLNEHGKEIFPELKITMDRWTNIDEINAHPFCEGLSLFRNPETRKYGYFDRNGHIVIPAKFTDALDFSDGLAVVSENEGYGEQTWGYINTQGEYVIPAKFHARPNSFHSGYAVAYKSNGEYVWIDKTGKTATQGASEDIFSHFYNGVGIQVARGGYQETTYIKYDSNLQEVDRFIACEPFATKFGLSHMSEATNVYYIGGKRMWLVLGSYFVCDEGKIWLCTKGNHDIYVEAVMDNQYIYARYDNEYYIFDAEGRALVHFANDEF